MPRKYEKVQELLPAVKELQGAGYTYRQIAERLGLGGKEVVEQLMKKRTPEEDSRHTEAKRTQTCKNLAGVQIRKQAPKNGK